MTHKGTGAAVGSDCTATIKVEDAMGTRGARVAFVCLALAAASLVGVLEVKMSGGGAPAPDPDMQPLAPRMAQPIEGGSLGPVESARQEAFREAVASRDWEALLAAGDAALSIGEATPSRRLEADARRLYLSALFRARAQRSLDGVLRATESFARLGDQDVVEQGFRIARGLAGTDPEAPGHVGR